MYLLSDEETCSVTGVDCVEDLTGMLCVTDNNNLFALFFKLVIEAAAALEAEIRRFLGM